MVLVKIFLNFINVFSRFVTISPCKGAGSFIWNNLNPHRPRILYANFDWIWPSGYNEYFVIIPPCKRARTFICTNLNPFTKGCMVPNLVDIGPVVLIEDFKISSIFFSIFRNYLPLKWGGALHLNKLESSSLKDALWQIWLKLVQWFWKRKWKCENDDDGQRTNSKKSSLEPKAQKVKIVK